MSVPRRTKIFLMGVSFNEISPIVKVLKNLTLQLLHTDRLSCQVQKCLFCGIILNMAKNKGNIEQVRHSLAHLMMSANIPYWWRK